MGNHLCVYVRWRIHSESEYNGCEIQFENKTDVICMCNHLTNFAIIMKDRKVINNPEVTKLVIHSPIALT